MNGWQIGGGFLVAVFLPALVRWPDDTLQFTSDSLHNALFASAAALLLGYGLARKLADFPSLQAFSVILPAFSASYALAAVALLLTRHDYSRYQLVASFILALAFYSWTFSARGSRPSLRLAVIPHGMALSLVEHDDVAWSVWRDLDRLPTGHDGLVVDARSDLGRDWEEFLERCAMSGIPVYHAKRVRESLTGRVAIEHSSENTLGSLVPSSLFAHVKHAADIAIAVCLLPLIVLICAVAGLLIKIDSPGPVFFVQPRVGYRGRVFDIVKLRTMRVGVAGDHARSFTQDDDPRVTRVGRVLRRYRIDELPQVINVFRGQMSWIGPRPEAVTLSAWYDAQIPFYSYRHIVRPGLTGWAQIHQGYAAELDTVTSKLQYDFFYIKNFSPWLDLLIVMQTFRTILSGFGAR